MEWNAIIDKITPYIIRIETPRGHGTGFLCLYNDVKAYCGVATAFHVVDHADKWQEPIRMWHEASNTVAFLRDSDRLVFSDWERDSAVILVPVGKLELPENLIPLRPTTDRLAIGTEVGWLGYPAQASYTLCFFSGNISAWQDSRHAYLIDGVAINGVSGGPVIHSTATEGVQIVGTISAYMANRATGEALPGLSIAQDISHLHDTTAEIKTMDEARKKRAEQQRAADQPAAPTNKSN